MVDYVYFFLHFYSAASEVSAASSHQFSVVSTEETVSSSGIELTNLSVFGFLFTSARDNVRTKNKATRTPVAFVQSAYKAEKAG